MQSGAPNLYGAQTRTCRDELHSAVGLLGDLIQLCNKPTTSTKEGRETWAGKIAQTKSMNTFADQTYGSFAQRLLCCPSDGSRLCPRDRDCHSVPGHSSLQLHVKVDLSCRATLVCLAQSQPGEGSHCYQELETELPRLTKPTMCDDLARATEAQDGKKNRNTVGHAKFRFYLSFEQVLMSSVAESCWGVGRSRYTC